MKRVAGFCLFMLIAFTSGAPILTHASTDDTLSSNRQGRMEMTFLVQDEFIGSGGFWFDSISTVHTSIVPITTSTDRYTVTPQATRFRSATFAPLSLVFERGLRRQYDRDVSSNIVHEIGGNTALIQQMNELVQQLDQSKIGPAGHAWQQRIPIFSSVHNPMSGRNPMASFNISPIIPVAGTKGVRVLRYESEEFSFITSDGGQITLRASGLGVVDPSWTRVYFSGFQYEGWVLAPDGKRSPVRGQNRMVMVHPVSSKPVIALDQVPELDGLLARFASMTASLESPEVLEERPMPVWLSDLYRTAGIAQVLSTTIAEQRTNPLPLLAASAAVIAVDSIVTLAWNTGVDIARVIAGDKKVSEINPFDNTDPLKTQGLVDNLTDAAGSLTTKGLKMVGVSDSKADAVGGIVNTALDVGAMALSLSKAAASAPRVLWGKSAHLNGALKKATITLGKLSYQAQNLGRLGTRLGKFPVISKALDIKSATYDAFQKGRDIGTNLNKLFDDGDQGAGDQTQSAQNLAGAVFTATRNGYSDSLANMAPTYDLIPSLSGNIQQLVQTSVQQAISNYFVTGARVATGNAAFQLASVSTGGLSNITVSLGASPLEFRIYDYAVEDGDRVRVQVRSLSGVNLGPTDITMTNAGHNFSANVARGPVEIGITALNEGSFSPNTGGISILSQVSSGPAHQTFSLRTGETGVLAVTVQ